MSGPFDEKFTDDQRDACAIAYCDGATAKQVAAAAAAGTLKHRGKPLEPFEIKPSYIGSLGQRERKRRQGTAVSHVAELPHRDAIENLRRRLISAADTMLTAYEKQLARNPANADPERHRQLVRCALEASKLPGPTAHRPTAQEQPGQKGPRTLGGIGGALLKDHRQGRPAQDEAQHATDGGDSSAAQRTQPRLNERSDDGPGSLTGEQRRRAGALAVGG